MMMFVYADALNVSRCDHLEPRMVDMLIPRRLSGRGGEILDVSRCNHPELRRVNILTIQILFLEAIVMKESDVNISG
jgi:hypothetical protein